MFENAWTATQKQALGKSVNGELYLPIIPLLGNANVAPLFDRFVKFNVQIESPTARH